MKLSEYINELNKLLESAGDVEVLTRDPFRSIGAYRVPPFPVVAHKAILLKRERTSRFHGYSQDTEENRGEKVVRV